MNPHIFFEKHLKSFYPKYKHNVVVSDIRQAITELERLIDSLDTCSETDLFDFNIDILLMRLTKGG